MLRIEIGEDGLEKSIEETIVVEKTIKELWESEDRKEREIAQRYSTQIITAMLESTLLDIDAMGNVEGFATK